MEDGRRAIVIDEAVVAYVWVRERHRFLEGVKTVDYRVLKTVKDFTGGLEVKARSGHQWEEAILSGYDVWRQINERRGGVIEVDLEERGSSWSAEGLTARKAVVDAPLGGNHIRAVR